MDSHWESNPRPPTLAVQDSLRMYLLRHNYGFLMNDVAHSGCRREAAAVRQSVLVS